MKNFIKLIIEFNGTYWHYHESLFPDENKEHRGITPKQYREYWKKKIDLANKRGFEVFEVWEHDYKNNPQKVIDQIMEKINERKRNYKNT